MFKWSTTMAVVVGAGLAMISCDTGDGLYMPPPGSDQRESMLTAPTVPTASSDVAEAANGETFDTLAGDAFAMTAPWEQEGVIPPQYGCLGEGLSPAVSWRNVPDGVTEIAIVFKDANEDFVHWVVWGLDAGASVAEGALPAGAKSAVNDFGNPGYGGPCPPEGESNAFELIVFALAEPILLADGVSADEAAPAIYEMALAEASIGASYP